MKYNISKIIFLGAVFFQIFVVMFEGNAEMQNAKFIYDFCDFMASSI